MGQNDRSLNVMCVDDDPLWLQTVRRCTARLATFFGAENSERALVIARREMLDLAMLDLHLIGPNGLDIATVLRCEFPLLGIAIVTSACVDEKLRAEAIDRGADVCWEKPYSSSMLRARIDALTMLRAERAARQPTLAEQNRRTIVMTERAFGGNRMKTARVLGYSRRGIAKKLDRLEPE